MFAFTQFGNFFQKRRASPVAVRMLLPMVLFWAIFDSILLYSAPLLIAEQGFSKTSVGAILALSSIAGILFDFCISAVFKNAGFRRIFFVMFAVCTLFPYVLWRSNTLWLYLVSMALWGFYADLFGFGMFNFIGVYTKKNEHISCFGKVYVFWAFGKVLAPLIAGIIIIEAVTLHVIGYAWIFLSISFLFFLALLFTTRKLHLEKRRSMREKKMSFLCEAQLWKKVGKSLAPVLLMTFFLYFSEAFFWTIAPLYANDLHSVRFGGMFLAAYSLPPLLVGWFVGSVAKRIEKKKAAFLGLFAGSVLLSLFPLVESRFWIVILVFIISSFVSFAFPAIDSIYADYIEKFPKAEPEIEGLADVMYNFGYVVGPLCAGILADATGIPFAFSFLGIIGVVVALILLKITPKDIQINLKPSSVI